MKVGIVGAGLIVPEFLQAAAQVPQIEIQAVYGRAQSLEKLKKLASEYQIREVYTDYDVFLSSSIDTVYVAVPNYLHFAMAKAALSAGKNVIVEKPFTSNKRQAEILCELAKEKRCYLFEAIANLYLPNFIETKKRFSELGEIKMVMMNYSQYSRRYDAFKRGEILPVFDPKKAGGALMDLGVYNIHYMTALFGRPKKICYYANVEKNIDVSGVLMLEYDGMMAAMAAAKNCKAPASVSIQGDEACLYSSSSSNMYEAFDVMRKDGSVEHIACNGDKYRMYYELQAFASIVECDDFDSMLGAMNHTLMVMEILDEARLQAGIDILSESEI